MSKDQKPVTRLDIEHIRTVFPSEVRHFTTWLEQHIEALADRLGIELSNVQREQAVGDFNVDLLCEDGSGRRVIIENQLGQTDHDHLGKLLTYLVNLEAATAIWVTPEPRPEHSRVVDWLNEATPSDTSFYLVKAEAVRIGDSPYAPLFTVLAGPDPQSKKVGDQKKHWAERDLARYEFWGQLLEKSSRATRLFANASPRRSSWIAASAGKPGVGFVYVIWLEDAATELYIDWEQDRERSKAVFDALAGDRETIEREFGEPLSWERLDERRASRIRKRFGSGGLSKPEVWDRLQEQMVASMVKLEKALKPRLDKIKV
jgi:hypothetical protein